MPKKESINDIVKQLAGAEGRRRAKVKKGAIKKTVVMRVRKTKKTRQPLKKTRTFKKRYFIDKFAVNGGVEYEIFTITVPKQRAKSKKQLLRKVSKVVR